MKTRFKSALAMVLVMLMSVIGLTAPANADPALEADVDTIKSRLMEYFYGQGDEIILANNIYLARTSDAMEYVETINPDGSWSDVNYADRTSSANGGLWQAYIALYRMIAMAQAYQEPSNPGYGDPTLLTALENSLLYWDQVNPGNTNWWETEIGESMAMGRISIFVGPELSPAAFEVTLKHNTGSLDPVGGNGAWRTTNYLYEALATNNFDNIRVGFDTIVQTVRVDNSGATNEAVQPDSSFWAHGAQLYSEGYGMVLFTYAALWADVARETDFAFSRNNLDAIAFYIIGGTRWLIRGELGMLYLNYRPYKVIDGVARYSSEFIEPLKRMARVDPLYSTSYHSVLDGIMGDSQDNGITGNKYMWRSEFNSHIRDEYGVFLRMNSNRTVGSEYRAPWRPSVGNEIFWNSAGVHAIQVDNNEYTPIGAAFDWLHYPGATNPYVRVTQQGSFSTGGAFTGAVSDGQYSTAINTLDRQGSKAKKGYFFFDDEFVALGTDITSTNAAAMHTTVNQTVSKTNASINGAPVAFGTDAAPIADVDWAYNDQVGYVFPNSPTVHVSNKTQTGSWANEAAMSADVFSLFFDHGVNPDAASYEYIVLPAASEAEVEAYAAAPAVEILRNDSSVQAVRHPGLQRTSAIFHLPGTLDLGNGRTLDVNSPSIVMLDESGDVPVVSVANPNQPNANVFVTLTTPDSIARGIYNLGAGATLGKTVTQSLSVSETADASCAASSSQPGHGPEAFCDGDTATEWQSNGSGVSWVSKLLPYGAHLTGASINWGDDYATKYLLQTSTDGFTWVDQQFVQGGAGGEEALVVSPTPASYARLLLIDGVNGDQYSIREFTPEYTVNLALGRLATASGGESIGSAVDGSLSTRWIANLSDTSWYQVDLGSAQPVKNVRVHWETSFATRYKIQVSDDGQNWRDAYESTADSTGGVQLHEMDETARYVRMQTVKRAMSQYGVSIWELEVFGDTKIADAPDVQFGKANLALKRPITADSTYSGFNVTAVNDGSLTSRWASERQNAPYTIERWVQVELDGVQTINQAFVKWEGATSNDYRIEGSMDGQTWTQIAHVVKSSSDLENTVNFADAQANYVRLIGLPSTRYGISIFEFELYGGYNLTCEAAEVVLDRNSSGTLAVSVVPFSETDTFQAFPLDDNVLSVVGEPRTSSDGRVEFDVVTGSAGATSVLITHSNGDESIWCPVTLTVDSTQLESLIATANGLDSRDYTTESWVALLPALEHAKALLDAGATQEEIDDAIVALQAALDGLVEAPAVAPSSYRSWATVNDRTVTLEAATDVPTALSLEYAIGIGDWLPYTAPFTVEGADAATVTFRAVDSNGLAGPTGRVTVPATEVSVDVIVRPLGVARTVLVGDSVGQLGAWLVDANGAGVAKADVQFTVTGGAFAGGATSVTVTTNVGGVAPLPAVTATAPGSLVVTAHYGNHEVDLPLITVVEPDPTVGADVTVSTKVVSSKVVIEVAATNTSGEPARVKITTRYGSKTFTDIADGATVTNDFKTFATKVPAGPVTVTVSTASGEATIVETYDAR